MDDAIVHSDCDSRRLACLLLLLHSGSFPPAHTTMTTTPARYASSFTPQETAGPHSPKKLGKAAGGAGDGSSGGGGVSGESGAEGPSGGGGGSSGSAAMAVGGAGSSGSSVSSTAAAAAAATVPGTVGLSPAATAIVSYVVPGDQNVLGTPGALAIPAATVSPGETASSGGQTIIGSKSPPASAQTPPSPQPTDNVTIPQQVTSTHGWEWTRRDVTARHSLPHQVKQGETKGGTLKPRRKPFKLLNKKERKRVRKTSGSGDCVPSRFANFASRHAPLPEDSEVLDSQLQSHPFVKQAIGSFTKREAKLRDD
uniref:Uncharacterized protein n=1 Tax=Anopheles atroparvus TaxID=41427 RepID=A0A182J7F4_ANOAO